MIMMILLPLMVALEAFKDARLLDKAANVIQPVMKFFSLPKEAAYPLLAGLLFGISYGSGVILAISRQNKLDQGHLLLIGVFLAVCHGIIEDPLLFAAIGANWWVLMFTRIFVGIVAMFVLAKVIKNNRLKRNGSA
jgi:spore maturation protein SpmB